MAAMIQRTVERMYSETEENQFLEVTYANGDKEILYFKDFNSGAMIQNIVDRAKKMAIKDFLETGQKGIRIDHLLTACVDEFKENEDLPEHDQPRRLGADLRQEGRADRLHPHDHPGQAGHRARPVDRHRRQHRPVPVAADVGRRPVPAGPGAPFACGVGRGSGVAGRVSWYPAGMTSRIAVIAIDALDPDRIAQFWCEVLGWVVIDRDEDGLSIGPAVVSPVAGPGPTIDVFAVPERKTVKNRLHLDLRADGPDRAEELDRLLALGARRVDVGQDPAVSWTVLADPEGNEFCLLGSTVAEAAG